MKTTIGGVVVVVVVVFFERYMHLAMTLLMFALSYSVTHGFVLICILWLFVLFCLEEVTCHFGWWNFQTEDIYSIVIHPVGCLFGCIEKPGFGNTLLAIFSEVKGKFSLLFVLYPMLLFYL